MGRHSTGAWTVYESLRIELSTLLRLGYLKPFCQLSGPFAWKNQRGEASGRIGLKTHYIPGGSNNYIELAYTISYRDGREEDFCYRVRLVEVPSNLGKGSVLYFLCPQTGQKCRILYKAYDSTLFKSRSAYSNRLYYTTQKASRLSYYNDYYWQLEDHIMKLKAKNEGWKRTYKGEPTRAARRLQRLQEQQERLDELRWTLGAPKSIREALQAGTFHKW